MPGCDFCGPLRSTYTIALKPCCGAFPGDVCDCAEFAAEAERVFAQPIAMGAPRVAA